jgi:hypothetical protein
MRSGRRIIVVCSRRTSAVIAAIRIRTVGIGSNPAGIRHRLGPQEIGLARVLSLGFLQECGVRSIGVTEDGSDGRYEDIQLSRGLVAWCEANGIVECRFDRSSLFGLDVPSVVAYILC